jgi:tetratricopeptide (TPR) repeat protein
LFRRAVEIALQARAGDQALAATRAWRGARPESLEAMRMELQILTALNRVADTAEPLSALLAATPEAERAALISGVPGFLQRAGDRQQAAQLIEKLLTPYLAQDATRVQARVAIGRGWLAAGESERALKLARQGRDDDAKAAGPALLALELMPAKPEAEALVLAYLSQPGSEAGVRLAYVRVLTGGQRYNDAIGQLQTITREQPDLAAPWLTLGALQLEMRHPKEGEAALQRYVQLTQTQAAAQAQATTKVDSAAADGDDEDENDAAPAAQGLSQAWLLLSQAAEQRGDFAAAESYLAKVDDPRRSLEVQTRRASLLARQGKLPEARALLRQAPERSAEDARAKLVAEAEVLRDVKQWAAAYEVLNEATERFPSDVDLLYEQAMMAEKLLRFDDMERLLRKVIAIKPDHAHAYNALGYSLADRSLRLPEAQTLVRRALELMPGDPFITDSLGWVEFRLGNSAEALRLLQQAYAKRPDTEIGVHLGEVLWAAGQRDEALRIWREARVRDAGNEVLVETLTRLKVVL